MTEIFIDPDSLTAAATVADRQRSHVQGISSYISSACGQFGAFTGVLNIFEGNYRSAVETAVDGMTDGMTIAEKVSTCLLATRNDFLDTDREVHEEFKRLFGDVGELPPYEAPGSGQSVPGTGRSESEAPEQPEDEPFEIPTLPGLPDPLGNQSEEGGAGVDERADTTNRDQIEERAETARQDAYDQAIADGKTPEEAREAGDDAYGDSRDTDGQERADRDRAGRGANDVTDVYDSVNETIENANDIIAGVDQLDQTTDDIEDYEDYEDRPEDRSSQEWGDR